MKTGKPTKCIDKAGRVVIPKDIRRAVGLDIGDEVSFEISGKGVLILPVSATCALCGSKYDLVPCYDKHVCKNCIKTLKMI